MMKSGLAGRGGEAVALHGVEVKAEVVAGHACATVRQRYKNEEKKPIEAIYTFPLPTKAILTGFSMAVEGRRIEGEVHEREEAFRRYDDAITAGHGAALLEQERPNVFTANVGNLLPGEETIIEIQYVEPVIGDEGAVRWSIPTLVAPRYIPGNPSGDRTAHGTVAPTTRVPDADRISPPIGNVSYGLSLHLTFDLGAPVDVESPSHTLQAQDRGNVTEVRFSQKEVALDRDVVVTAYARAITNTSFPIASVVTHRKGKEGALGLTIVPDLGATKRSLRTDVVFVLDRSGSMGGSSMDQARTALRLCLRQLREGDRFNILAFDDQVEPFKSGKLVPFTQAMLQAADTWLASVDARGGTELLQPMTQACALAPDGVIVLLTDGQVGNEAEIEAEVLRVRKSARVYSFGIGTNVSDALLAALADKTTGALEMIHPGERIDEKIVAQFARATAARVTDVTIKTRGIELGEMAPAEAAPLIDGEPYSLFATYEEAGRGVLELRGKLDGENFYLEIPVDLEAKADRPVISKLWAQARIRDLEKATVSGRRADSMKDRIVKLATTYGVSSKYTSFVVVEKRTGDRRTHEQAETRVVPVNAPAGWARAKGMDDMADGASMKRAKRSYGFGGQSVGASRGAPPPPRAAGRPMVMPPAVTLKAPAHPPGAPLPRPQAMAAMPMSVASAPPPMKDTIPAPKAEGGSMDMTPFLLSQQAASGLWESEEKGTVHATMSALRMLLDAGVDASHPIYGAQIKKAIDALVIYLAAHLDSPDLAAALGLLIRLGSGRRTRQSIEELATKANVQLSP